MVFVLLFDSLFSQPPYDGLCVSMRLFSTGLSSEPRRIESSSTRCALNALKALPKPRFLTRTTAYTPIRTHKKEDMTRTYIHSIDHAHIVWQTEKGTARTKQK